MTIADINLLNQDRLLLLAMASAALMVLVVAKQKAVWLKTRLPFHLAGGLLLGCIVWWWLQRLFSQDAMPLTIIWWITWLAGGISIVFTIHRARKDIILAVMNAVLATLLALMLANQYYQFFPTVGSLFDTSVATATADKTYFSTASTPTTSSLESTYIPAAGTPAHGQLVNITIPGDTSHFHPRASFAYVPPAALSDPTVKLPVIVGLAGVPGSPGDWSARVGIQAVLDNFADQHKGLAPIIVIADQTGGNGFVDTGCVDSPRGNVETYLTKDVPAYIQQRFGVSSDSSQWAIGGFSDGGMCSITLGLRHPDVYKTILSLSGATAPSAGSLQQTLATFFNGSPTQYKAHDSLALLSNNDLRQKLAHSGMWLTVGRDEQQSLIQANHNVFDKGKSLGLDMTLEILPGHHSFGLWKQGMIDALPWLSHRLGLTSCATSCK